MISRPHTSLPNCCVGASERYFRSHYEDRRRDKEQALCCTETVTNIRNRYVFSHVHSRWLPFTSRNFPIDAKHLRSIRLQIGHHRGRIELGRYLKTQGKVVISADLNGHRITSRTSVFAPSAHRASPSWDYSWINCVLRY